MVWTFVISVSVAKQSLAVLVVKHQAAVNWDPPQTLIKHGIMRTSVILNQ